MKFLSLRTLGLAVMFGVVTVFGAVIEAQAGEFHVRNCTPKRAFVCAYNTTDSSLTTASDAGGVHSGSHKQFKCTSKNCKVFIGFSKKDIGAIIARDVGIAAPTGMMGSTAISGGVYLSDMFAAAAADEVVVTTSAGPVGAAVLGIVVAAVVIDVAAETNAVCKKIINHVKHSKHGKAIRQSHIHGHHTIAMLHDTQNNPYLQVSHGDSCPN